MKLYKLTDAKDQTRVAAADAAALAASTGTPFDLIAIARKAVNGK